MAVSLQIPSVLGLGAAGGMYYVVDELTRSNTTDARAVFLPVESF